MAVARHCGLYTDIRRQLTLLMIYTAYIVSSTVSSPQPTEAMNIGNVVCDVSNMDSRGIQDIQCNKKCRSYKDYNGTFSCCYGSTQCGITNKSNTIILNKFYDVSWIEYDNMTDVDLNLQNCKDNSTEGFGGKISFRKPSTITSWIETIDLIKDKAIDVTCRCTKRSCMTDNGMICRPPSLNCSCIGTGKYKYQNDWKGKIKTFIKIENGIN
ncbi:uncharacterized protein LOC117331041 [Pecten maximus]|uniref:uncharacterized protein LOC117331041 n=1 Tax=Pecten maximus TaxID=6579 RepID=UPI001458578D|nr:uncharacterized protein LOC117331041 [Pecten maximus]